MSLRSLLTASPSVPSVYGPRQVQVGAATTAFISSVAQASEAFPGLIPGRGGLVLIMSIIVEETQAEESFTIYVPPTAPGVERPMLTAFHGFNVSHLDIWANTSFIEECQARDWILIAPYQRNLALTGPGTSQISFGSVQSQLHVQAVIDYVISNFSVDLDRIYGVGFSMGGGSALSYAARHRDRDRGAFAAVVNHTGTVSLQNTYYNVDAALQALMVRIFNGSPPFVPFEYARSSCIELDVNGDLVTGGRHMARNLADVPVRSYYGIGDSQQYLIQQSIQLDAFMSTVSSNHELVAVPSSCPNPAQQGHCWNTIDEVEICDWFDQQTLGAPGLIGQILADRGGRWGNLRVQPTDPGGFAALDYSVSNSQNSIRLVGTDNLEQVELDLVELSLSSAVPIGIRTQSADGSSDRILIGGLPARPLSVTRNGVSLTEDCLASNSSGWCYDVATGELLLTEASGLMAIWSIVP